MVPNYHSCFSAVDSAHGYFHPCKGVSLDQDAVLQRFELCPILHLSKGVGQITRGQPACSVQTTVLTQLYLNTAPERSMCQTLECWELPKVFSPWIFLWLYSPIIILHWHLFYHFHILKTALVPCISHIFYRHLTNSKSSVCQCSTQTTKFEIRHGDRQISALQIPLFINPYKLFYRYCCSSAVLLQLGSCWNVPFPPFILTHLSPSIGKDNQTVRKSPVQRPENFVGEAEALVSKLWLLEAADSFAFYLPTQHRIIEWAEGTLSSCPSNPLPWTGPPSTRPDCSRPFPMWWNWTLPEWGIQTILELKSLWFWNWHAVISHCLSLLFHTDVSALLTLRPSV